MITPSDFHNTSPAKISMMVAAEAVNIYINYDLDHAGNNQAKLVNECGKEAYDGIVVSTADAKILESSIQAATDAGIPVVTINVFPTWVLGRLLFGF